MHKTQIAQNVDSVEDGIKSIICPGTHRTIHQIRETGIPKTSVHAVEAAVL